MSYLNPLRLHFSGRFQANVSTVNNDPSHFDNATFEQSYQELQSATSANGWFNPEGDASFRLLGCAVTSAWMPGGAVGAADPVLSVSVADANGRVCAKMADLDSMQQLVSQIWGLQVRFADASGNTLMSGSYKPAAFMDIWTRATGGGGGDVAAGAMYQSVLTDLSWGDVSGSAFLSALKAASAASGRLSIKFNVDGFNLNYKSPDFMCGRLAGTIGPAEPDEPNHLVLGRQFMAENSNQPGFFIPANGINFFVAKVDTAASCILLDLGNALSTVTPGGGMNDVGRLTLGMVDPVASSGNPAGTVIALGTIEAHGPTGYVDDTHWYRRTAGVVSLPLSPAQLAAVATQPLVLAGDQAASPGYIGESPNGAFVRADEYVYRLSPGEAVQVSVYATLFGTRCANASISFVADSGQLQPLTDQNNQVVIPVAVPLSALPFNPSATTDARGIARLVMEPTDPGTPRYFNDGQDYGLDGQVYGIRASFTSLAPEQNPNQWNFISVLLWSGFAPPAPLTWDSISPILQQYANLYPVMKRFLDLGDFDSVVTHAHLLKLAFGLDPANPNAMPVTRDLSAAKRDAILAWLDHPLPGAAGVLKRLPKSVGAPAPAAASQAPAVVNGGKAEALARRMIML